MLRGSPGEQRVSVLAARHRECNRVDFECSTKYCDFLQKQNKPVRMIGRAYRD